MENRVPDSARTCSPDLPENSYLFLETKFLNSDSWIVGREAGDVNVRLMCSTCRQICMDEDDLKNHHRTIHRTGPPSRKTIISEMPLKIDTQNDPLSCVGGNMSELISLSDPYPIVPNLSSVEDVAVPKSPEKAVPKPCFTGQSRPRLTEAQIRKQMFKCPKCNVIYKHSRSTRNCLKSHGLRMCMICFEILPVRNESMRSHHITSGHVVINYFFDSLVYSWHCSFPECEAIYENEFKLKCHIGETHLWKVVKYRNTNYHHLSGCIGGNDGTLATGIQQQQFDNHTSKENKEDVTKSQLICINKTPVLQHRSENSKTPVKDRQKDFEKEEVSSFEIPSNVLQAEGGNNSIPGKNKNGVGNSDRMNTTGRLVQCNITDNTIPLEKDGAELIKKSQVIIPELKDVVSDKANVGQHKCENSSFEKAIEDHLENDEVPKLSVTFPLSVLQNQKDYDGIPVLAPAGKEYLETDDDINNKDSRIMQTSFQRLPENCIRLDDDDTEIYKHKCPTPTHFRQRVQIKRKSSGKSKKLVIYSSSEEDEQLEYPAIDDPINQDVQEIKRFKVFDKNMKDRKNVVQKRPANYSSSKNEEVDNAEYPTIRIDGNVQAMRFTFSDKNPEDYENVDQYIGYPKVNSHTKLKAELSNSEEYRQEYFKFNYCAENEKAKQINPSLDTSKSENHNFSFGQSEFKKLGPKSFSVDGRSILDTEFEETAGSPKSAWSDSQSTILPIERHEHSFPDDMKPSCCFCGFITNSVEELKKHNDSCSEKDIFYRLESDCIFQTSPTPMAVCKICNIDFKTKRHYELMQHVNWCAAEAKKRVSIHNVNPNWDFSV